MNYLLKRLAGVIFLVSLWVVSGFGQVINLPQYGRIHASNTWFGVNTYGNKGFPNVFTRVDSNGVFISDKVSGSYLSGIYRDGNEILKVNGDSILRLSVSDPAGLITMYGKYGFPNLDFGTGNQLMVWNSGVPGIGRRYETDTLWNDVNIKMAADGLQNYAIGHFPSFPNRDYDKTVERGLMINPDNDGVSLNNLGDMISLYGDDIYLQSEDDGSDKSATIRISGHNNWITLQTTKKVGPKYPQFRMDSLGIRISDFAGGGNVYRFLDIINGGVPSTTPGRKQMLLWNGGNQGFGDRYESDTLWNTTTVIRMADDPYNVEQTLFIGSLPGGDWENNAGNDGTVGMFVSPNYWGAMGFMSYRGVHSVELNVQETRLSTSVTKENRTSNYVYYDHDKTQWYNRYDVPSAFSVYNFEENGVRKNAGSGSVGYKEDRISNSTFTGNSYAQYFRTSEVDSTIAVLIKEYMTTGTVFRGMVGVDFKYGTQLTGSSKYKYADVSGGIFTNTSAQSYAFFAGFIADKVNNGSTFLVDGSHAVYNANYMDRVRGDSIMSYKIWYAPPSGSGSYKRNFDYLSIPVQDSISNITLFEKYQLPNAQPSLTTGRKQLMEWNGGVSSFKDRYVTDTIYSVVNVKMDVGGTQEFTIGYFPDGANGWTYGRDYGLVIQPSGNYVGLAGKYSGIYIYDASEGGSNTLDVTTPSGNTISRIFQDAPSRSIGAYVADKRANRSQLFGLDTLGFYITTNSGDNNAPGTPKLRFPDLLTSFPSTASGVRNFLVWTGTGAGTATPSFTTMTGALVDGIYTTGTPSLTAFGTGSFNRYIAVVELTSGAGANTTVVLPTADATSNGKSILLSPRDLNTTYDIVVTGSIELNGAVETGIKLTQPTEFVCALVASGSVYRWVIVDNVTSVYSPTATTVNLTGDVATIDIEVGATTTTINLPEIVTGTPGAGQVKVGFEYSMSINNASAITINRGGSSDVFQVDGQTSTGTYLLTTGGTFFCKKIKAVGVNKWVVY